MKSTAVCRGLNCFITSWSLLLDDARESIRDRKGEWGEKTKLKKQTSMTKPFIVLAPDECAGVGVGDQLRQGDHTRLFKSITTQTEASANIDYNANTWDYQIIHLTSTCLPGIKTTSSHHSSTPKWQQTVYNTT